MLLWILPVIGGLTCLYLCSRYNLPEMVQGWRDLLRANDDAVLILENQARLEAAMIDCAYAAALRHRDHGNLKEALYQLDLARKVIAEAIPDRAVRLRGMRFFARMLTAAVPLRALAPREYQLIELKSLAGIAAVVERMLATTVARLQFRIIVLGWACRVLWVVMPRSTDQTAHGRVAPPWGAFGRAASDFKRLDAEHIEAFRALTSSLDERAEFLLEAARAR